MKDKGYIDYLIDMADSLPYMDYCRLMSVLYWNL
nr:MAG TPA: hypothetical protein [Bacteriophage sp.]